MKFLKTLLLFVSFVVAFASCDTISAAQYKVYKYKVADGVTVVVSDRSLENQGYYVYDLTIWEKGVKKLCSSSGNDGFEKKDTKELALKFYEQYQTKGCNPE